MVSHALEIRYTEAGLREDDCVRLYRLMRLTREFEMQMVALYKRGEMIGGCFTGAGNEATSVGSAFALQREDVLSPMHRDLGAYLAKGEDPLVIAMEYLGRADGPTRGTDGNLHHGNLDLGAIGMISHLGAMLPVAVGAVFARRQLGRDVVGMAYTGDGSTSQTDFHEAINYAAVQNIPVVFIVVNNQFAYSTPTSKQFACKSLADRAKGYGIPGVQVDGTDVLAVYRAAKEAVDRGRAGGGPTLIESVTMRMRGHSEHDDYESYVPAGMLEEWAGKDPLKRFETYLLEDGILDNVGRHKIEMEIASEVEAVLETALAAELPDGPEAAKGVYADSVNHENG